MHLQTKNKVIMKNLVKNKVFLVLVFISLFFIVYLAFAGIDDLFSADESSPRVIKIDKRISYFILTIITLGYPTWKFFRTFKNNKD